MFLAILLGPLIMLGSQQPPPEFPSAVVALHELDRMGECKCDTDVKAYRYFVNHPDESIPLLIDFTLRHKQRSFVGVQALSKIKDERVITFLVQLADDELHNRPKTIVGDDSYNRVHPYSSEDLVKDLVGLLGDYGNKRTIPIIEESWGRVNNNHRDMELEALCELGKISISELFDRHLKSVEEIHSIAFRNVYTNPKFSVEVFDWIINHFPQKRALVQHCHSDKVMALYNLEEYALALTECEILKQKMNHRSAKRMSFSVGHFGYSLDEMIRLLKTKVEIKK